ncbi:aminopeptidase [Sorangium cellulosum]|uniref:Aminopeptidase n=1 Tax=Sorangium cellulosum TaxID=56 RepID=A0A4P2PUU0_SORCE|nr:P1 family peptidase [Sorangium cellulosum]AUX20429.1 aminopeptidase [Sorangium cellulosum]
MSASASRIKRPRLRDLGVAIGRFATGRENAITDVAGVRVHHVTKIEGEGELVPGIGPVRTGVTAVMPAEGDIFLDRVFTASYVLNGAGEVTGLAQIDEWGLCETPILLCSTLCVGRVLDATVAWLSRLHPKIGKEYDVVIPVVAECDDSFLNDAVGRHVTQADVEEAIDNVRGGPVEEGCVGAGTGMQTFHFAGGIGTSSRRVPVGGVDAMVGALVLSNFGDRELLRVDGVPVGRLISDRFNHVPRRGPAGSIIVLVATDAPLIHRQLARLSRRAALAIGRAGGYAANNSGEIILSWSTANRVPRLGAGERTAPSSSRSLSAHPLAPGRHMAELVLDTELDELYEATVDVVEEAILNAIVAGVDMTGHSGHHAPALPLDAVAELLRRYRPPRPSDPRPTF